MTPDQQSAVTLADRSRVLMGDEVGALGPFGNLSDDREVHVMPAWMLVKFLGVPREDQPRFRAWADGLAQAKVSRERITATRRLHAYLASLVRRRQSSPEDDLTSRMAVDEEPDDRLPDPGAVATAMLLLVGARGKKQRAPASATSDESHSTLRGPGLHQGVRRRSHVAAATLPLDLGSWGLIGQGIRQA